MISQRLKDIYIELYNEVAEMALLREDIIFICERCKLSSNLILLKTYISSSSCGSGGNFDLCIDCAIESNEEANHANSEYYGSIL